MNIEDLLEAYSMVRRKHRLPAMGRVAVTTERRQGLTPDPTEGSAHSAWVHLASLAPREGWVQFQSRVETFANGRLPEPAEEWGYLFAAEALLADGRTVLLRPDGRGALDATLIGRAPGIPGIASASPMLSDEVRHLATDRAPNNTATLRYTRCWQRDPDRGLIPVIAVFEGFGQKED